MAVGFLCAPFIGYLQETSANRQLEAANPALYQTVTVEKTYLLGGYRAIDPLKSAAVTGEASQAAITNTTTFGQFSELGKMALFHIFMLGCYVAPMVYFKSRGGYNPVRIGDAGGGK